MRLCKGGGIMDGLFTSFIVIGSTGRTVGVTFSNVPFCRASLVQGYCSSIQRKASLNVIPRACITSSNTSPRTSVQTQQVNRPKESLRDTLGVLSPCECRCGCKQRILPLLGFKPSRLATSTMESLCLINSISVCILR